MTTGPDAIVVLLCADGDRVLVDAGNQLPSLRRPLREDEGALAPAWTDWGEFGVPGAVLDTLLDPTRGRGGVDPYVSLVVMDMPPTGYEPPVGWRWVGHGDGPTGVPSGFVDHVAQWMAERRGERLIPSARQPWNEPGWLERATRWIHESLAAVGRRPPTDVTLVKMWGISAVYRVDASDGVSWFKASSHHFAQEAPATRILHHAMPDRVPEVLATDIAERWLLMAGLDGVVGGSEIMHAVDPADVFTDIHRRSVAVMNELIAVGCPRRTITELPALVRSGLSAEVGRRYSDTDGVNVDRLVLTIEEAVASIEALVVPETVVHADLHGGNVASTSSGVVVFDWSDACVSHPLVDVVSWIAQFQDDADRVRRTWESFRDRWVEHFGVAWFEPDSVALELVGQAFLFDSYVKILESLEPVRHRECASGISDAFSRMVELTQTAR